MKHSIAQDQIIAEFVEAGGLSIVTYNRQTGKRLGTLGRCNMHRAFAEIVDFTNRDVLALVFNGPTKDDMKDYHDARHSPDLAEFDRYKFGSKPRNRR